MVLFLENFGNRYLRDYLELENTKYLVLSTHRDLFISGVFRANGVEWGGTLNSQQTLSVRVLNIVIKLLFSIYWLFDTRGKQKVLQQTLDTSELTQVGSVLWQIPRSKIWGKD